MDLATITDPATSATEIAKMFDGAATRLDAVAMWENAGVGGDAIQSTASLQPRYLKYSGTGYAFFPGAASNYLSTPVDANLGGLTNFVIQVDGLKLDNWRVWQTFVSRWNDSSSKRCWMFFVDSAGVLRLSVSTTGSDANNAQSSEPVPVTGAEAVRVTRDGGTVTFEVDYGSGFEQLGSSVSLGTGQASSTVAQEVEIGSSNNGSGDLLLGCMGRVRVWSGTDTGEAPLFDVNIDKDAGNRDTSFVSSSGHTVTVAQSGDDSATIIKRSVLRFDGDDDFLEGVVDAIDGARAIVLCNALGSGGDIAGRFLIVAKPGETSGSSSGALFGYNLSDNVSAVCPGDGTLIQCGASSFDGRMFIVTNAQNGDQSITLNGVAGGTSADALALDASEYFVGAESNGGFNAAIDVEAIYVYPPTLSDADFNRAVLYHKTQLSAY